MAKDVEAFEEAFRTIGYEPCDDGELEDSYEKVAIYSKGGLVKHMARQLPSGWWTSKLGKGDDIEHETPGELEGELYGTIASYMRRSVGVPD